MTFVPSQILIPGFVYVAQFVANGKEESLATTNKQMHMTCQYLSGAECVQRGCKLPHYLGSLLYSMAHPVVNADDLTYEGFVSIMTVYH